MERESNDQNCPICFINAKPKAVADNSAHENGGYWVRIECEACGLYFLPHKLVLWLTGSADKPLADRPRLATKKDSGLLSHHIRKIVDREGEAYVDGEFIKNIRDHCRLPDWKIRMNTLIVWTAENTRLGEGVEKNIRWVKSLIGCEDINEAVFLVSGMRNLGLLREKIHNQLYIKLGLTFAGRERYDEIMSADEPTTKAFMAMAFRKEGQDTLGVNGFYTELQKGVRQTGFDLNRVDERNEPGLIDQHIEVGLRTSRFVVADITYGNQGAYWEAGFAHGLGKKVIYTCEEEAFERDQTF